MTERAHPSVGWDHLIEAFYSPPNTLSFDLVRTTFATLIEGSRHTYVAENGSAHVLPASIGARNLCFVCVADSNDLSACLSVVSAYVGSWVEIEISTFRGAHEDEIDHKAFAFVAPSGGLLRLTIADSAEARRAVATGLRRFVKDSAEKPRRRSPIPRPLGRRIGDFWDSCAAGSEVQAFAVLDSLLTDHRLSRANALFLRLQFLANFGRWTELEELAELPDLLRLQRPAMASDALANLAMRGLNTSGSGSAPDSVLARFGALVPSTALIRSPAGACYYALWARGAGDPTWLIIRRLSDAGWLDAAVTEGKASFLASRDADDAEGSNEVDEVVQVQRAVDEGRFDSAIAHMRTMQPTVAAIPLLARLVVATLSPEAIEALRIWKEILGQEATDSALMSSSSSELTSTAEVLDFQEAFDLWPMEASPQARTGLLDRMRDTGVAFLMRPGLLQNFRGAVRTAATDVRYGSELLLDLLLDLERDLSLAQGTPSGLQDLRIDIAEFWSMLDSSADRGRLTRVVCLLERLLECGVNVAQYDEIVEYLRAGWPPFLTDADLPVGLEAIELLAATRPDDSSALDAFAIPILSRIGAHNAGRLGWALVEAARAIAVEFGLPINIATEDAPSPAKVGLVPPPKMYIALYSLMEPASKRAIRIIENLYPQAKVEALADKVGSPSLAHAGRYADVLVVADRAATHSATQTLLAARGQGVVDYARGKGTSSLLDAVERGVERLTLANVDD